MTSRLGTGKWPTFFYSVVHTQQQPDVDGAQAREFRLRENL